jgi:histidinol-phosphate aminotransferase
MNLSLSRGGGSKLIEPKQIAGLTRPILHKMKKYSPGKPIWEVQQELGLKDVIKLSSNENPLGASPLAKEAINQYVHELNRYPDADTTKLREAISIHYEVEPNQIIVGNGGDEIITLISETFLEEGDEIIVPTPTFSEYEFGGHLMGANVVNVTLDDRFEYDFSAILKSITDKTKLIYLCSPNNPTGTYIKKTELDGFLRELPDRVIVVLDGAYSQYATSSDYTNGLEYVKAGLPLIVIQTFSKIYGLAGIRVGYGISSKEIVQSIHKVREPFNVNMLAQVAAEAAIRDVRHVENSLNANQEGKAILYEAFQSLGLNYIESMANFILVDVGVNASIVFERLLEKGIIVRNGNVWGLPNHLRITVGTKSEIDALIGALKDILEQ